MSKKKGPPPKSAKGGKVAAEEKAFKLIAENKRARHLYQIDDEIEAGIMLTGTEVKSCRKAQVQLRDAYAGESKGEIFLHNAHISEYSHGNLNNHEPMRRRKLLLHRQEIKKLFGKLREKGYSMVPLKMYFKGAYVKVALGFGKGKKTHDKRASIKERESKREMERNFKGRNR